MKKNNTSKTFDKSLGISPVEQKKGNSRLKLKIKKEHLNHGGIVHGGVLSSLCDVALADAVHTMLKPGQWCVTIQLNIEYMQPAYLGEILYGFGKIKRIGNTLAFVDGGIETQDKRQITKAHGIWFIKHGLSKKIILNKTNNRKMDAV